MWFFQWGAGPTPTDEDLFEEIQAPFSLQSADVIEPSLVDTLSQLWRPLTTKGEIQEEEWYRSLLQETTFDSVDVGNLITTIKRTGVSEYQKAGVYKIGCHMLDSKVLEHVAKQIDVSNVYPDHIMKLRKRQLVVITPECTDLLQLHCLELSDNSIGTVEVILNSAFTGGELQVVHDGQESKQIVKPYDWVSVHTDVSCFINPVTSGTRVSLTYDITIFNKPILAVTSYSGDRYKDYKALQKKLLDGFRMDYSRNVPKLIALAKELRPELVGYRTLILNAHKLNPVAVKEIAHLTEQSGLLKRLFFNKKLDIRPTHLALHREEEEGIKRNHIKNERGKGYLGTLVVLLGGHCQGGDVHFSREGADPGWINNWRSCYAYAAGTTHKLKPIIRGTRVSLHYDIYDAGSSIPLHDPFASTATGFSEVITRTIPSYSVSCKVMEAMDAELATTDSVVITLQYAYQDSMQKELLHGGDRALYDILTSTPCAHEVHFVVVTLKYRVDPDTREKVLDSGTYRDCSSIGMVPSGSYENVKFVVPTKLTSQHRVEGNADILGPYFVKGLCVRKRGL